MSFSLFFSFRRFCLSSSVLLLVGLFTLSCRSDYPGATGQSQPMNNPEARDVRTAQVVEMPMGRSIGATGTLAAYDQTTVSTKVPGRVSRLSVDLGSVVKRGQLIAQLEQQDYQYRVQQAEAALAQTRARLGLNPAGSDDKVVLENTATVLQAKAVLEEARANRDRAAQLASDGVIAKAEWESANATYKVAAARYQDAIEEVRNRQGLLAQRRSELALARQQLADTAIYAPYEGVVQERTASLGEYLAAAAAVVVIVRMNPLRLRAEISERDAGSVRVGQTTRVTVDGDSNVYLGTIKRLSPTITEQTRVLLVEAEIANTGFLRPGMFVRADIVTDDSGMAVTVPTSAIVTFAGIEKVIMVQNGKAVEKPITTGRREADWTEVLAGVNVGEAVVVEPGNLQTGQPIKVVGEVN